MNFRFPVTLEVTNRKCTIVGGGQVAARKASKLLQAGARIHLVSPVLCPQLEQLSQEGRVDWVQRSFNVEDLPGSLLVIAATDDRAINAQIAQYCQEHNILVNVVDSPEESSFITSASLSRGDLLIAVSTNGQNPAFGQKIRAQLEDEYGAVYGEALQVLNEARELLKIRCDDVGKRGQIMKILIDSDIFELVVAGEIDQARERVQKCISTYLG